MIINFSCNLGRVGVFFNKNNLILVTSLIQERILLTAIKVGGGKEMNKS